MPFKSFFGALLIAFGVSFFASAQQLDCRAGFDDLQGAKSPIPTFKHRIKHTLDKHFLHLLPASPRVRKIVQGLDHFSATGEFSDFLPVPIESLTPLEINQLLSIRWMHPFALERHLSWWWGKWYRNLFNSLLYDNMTDDIMQSIPNRKLHNIEPRHFSSLGIYEQIFKLPKTLTRATDEQFQAAIKGLARMFNGVHKLKKMPIWFFLENAYRLPLSDKDKKEVLEDLGFKGHTLQILMKNSRPGWLGKDNRFLANLRQKYPDSEATQSVSYTVNDRLRSLKNHKEILDGWLQSAEKYEAALKVYDFATIRYYEDRYRAILPDIFTGRDLSHLKLKIKELKDRVKDIEDDIKQIKHEKQLSSL